MDLLLEVRLTHICVLHAHLMLGSVSFLRAGHVFLKWRLASEGIILHILCM